jgi:predicted ATPase
MESARIESITIEGHTSIESARVDLGPVNVLVGANGSGKSNFIRALELLGRIVDQVFQYETIDGNTGVDIVAIPGVRESRLRDIAFDNRKEVSARRVYQMLAGCRVFHFHDTSRTAPVKQPGPTADNLTLAADAGNLAAVLAALQQSDQITYRRIVRAVQQVAPFFRDFVLQPEGTDRIRLRWRQNDSDTVFSAHQMSDGTLRFICLATLLLQPNPPQLVVLDEPELGLHPYAIGQLAEMLRAASVDHQVVVATQSVTLMDQFALSDLIVVERERGASVFHRPDSEKLRDWLAEYSLGELWQKNIIGGRPKREPA